MPVLLLMDLLGMAAYRKTVDRRLLMFLLPSGLLGIVVGALLFKLLDARVVAGIVGVFTLLFLAQRLLFPPSKEGHVAPRWVGRLLAVASGVTSFIAHAGSPPISAWLLPMRLEPLRLAGTSAVFFAAINASKIPPYAALGLIDWRNMLTALVLLPLAPLGVWIGVWLTHRVSSALFYRIAYLGMGLTGAKLLYDGLR
jgi:uncharacterized membrane protein YfcA